MCPNPWVHWATGLRKSSRCSSSISPEAFWPLSASAPLSLDQPSQITHLAPGCERVHSSPCTSWPSSSSTSRNCGFPLCSSLQVPKREDLTSAFLFKPKHTRPRSLGIIYGHSLGPGAQLVMVMVIGPTDMSVRSVDRDFTRKGCEWASNNWYV